MLLFAHTISKRLEYIATTIFHKIECTTNAEKFIAYKQPKINYSNNPISQCELWIQPNGLINETNIRQQNIQVFTWNELPVFFKTQGTIPFDFFAAAFYLITRYEEYLPHEKDMYGRFAHTNSIAFKHNFLQLPLINLWVQHINQFLYLQTSSIQYPVSSIQHTPFTFLPTYDIDIAYSYKHYNIVRNVVGFFRDLLKLNFEAVAERLQVYANAQQDPFDVYDWLNNLHTKYKLKPVYFFLMANKRVGYDKNLDPNAAAMQQLIQQHANQYEVGIHPSWQSGDNEKLLATEIATLHKITHKNIHHSRQHYIRMDLPKTYQTLVDNGITQDYSMGYGSINGFRASYTLPFNWYNLQKEEPTNLTIHPFCYMEANSFFEQKLTIDEAEIELQNYFNAVKNVNGQFITIFHNHFLTQQPQWVAWRNMYEHFLERNFYNKT